MDPLQALGYAGGLLFPPWLQVTGTLVQNPDDAVRTIHGSLANRETVTRKDSGGLRRASYERSRPWIYEYLREARF